MPADVRPSVSFLAAEPLTSASCQSAVVDQSGNIAVAFGAAQGTDRFWRVYGPDGSDRAGLAGFDLFPQGCGFTGSFMNPNAAQLVASWSPQGAPIGGDAVGGDRIARTWPAFPQGMLALLQGCSAFDSTTSGVSLWRFGPAGETLAEVRLQTRCSVTAVAAGTDLPGNLLLLAVGDVEGTGFAAEDLLGRWFDPSGNPLTAWFRIDGGARALASYATTPLIGGGIAIQVDGAWRYAVAGAAPTSQAVPAFLAAHPGAGVALVRRARAYAVLPRDGGDASEVDLYSAEGQLCGSLRLPGANAVVGADGSVVTSSGATNCAETVWRQLLH